MTHPAPLDPSDPQRREALRRSGQLALATGLATSLATAWPLTAGAAGSPPAAHPAHPHSAAPDPPKLG